MAYEIPLMNRSFEAGADLSADQFKFVKLNASGLVVLCAAATDLPVGVLQNDPTLGQTAQVMMLGISKVSADEAMAEGYLIGTSADGQAARVEPGTDTTAYICGQIIGDGDGAAGELVTASINCMAPARGA